MEEEIERTRRREKKRARERSPEREYERVQGEENVCETQGRREMNFREQRKKEWK